MSWVAGITMSLIRGSALRPLRMWAAILRSSILALVQEPMKTWSTSTLPADETGWAFEGRDGNETWGSRALMSMEWTVVYWVLGLFCTTSMSRYRPVAS